MKLKFKNQEFQTDAVNAAVELFNDNQATFNAYCTRKDLIIKTCYYLR